MPKARSSAIAATYWLCLCLFFFHHLIVSVSVFLFITIIPTLFYLTFWAFPFFIWFIFSLWFFFLSLFSLLSLYAYYFPSPHCPFHLSFFLTSFFFSVQSPFYLCSRSPFFLLSILLLCQIAPIIPSSAHFLLPLSSSSPLLPLSPFSFLLSCTLSFFLSPSFSHLLLIP